MFGISGFELLILAAFVLIIFGPDKLPQLVKTFSSAMRMFKSAQADMERMVKAEMLMGDKFDLEKAMRGESTAGTSSSTASTASSSASIEASGAPTNDDSAAAVWAATAEDDDEEEDEE